MSTKFWLLSLVIWAIMVTDLIMFLQRPGGPLNEHYWRNSHIVLVIGGDTVHLEVCMEHGELRAVKEVQ